MKKSIITFTFILSAIFAFAQSEFAHPGIFVGSVVEDLDRITSYNVCYTKLLRVTNDSWS